MSNPNSYFNRVRDDIIALVERGDNSILEIGCGEGNTLRKLKTEGKATHVVGIDIHETSINKAKKYLDQAILGDIEKMKFDFKCNHFDYIIAADVLEHLRDPQRTLKKLIGYLKPDGFIIVSVPNIRNITILKNLILHDRWEYADKGILDKTHLRFFTKGSFTELANELNLKIIDYKFSSPDLSKPIKLFNFILRGKLAPFYVVQHIFKLQKSN